MTSLQVELLEPLSLSLGVLPCRWCCSKSQECYDQGLPDAGPEQEKEENAGKQANFEQKTEEFSPYFLTLGGGDGQRN